MALSPLHAFLISFAIGFIAGFSFFSVTLGWLALLIPGASQFIFMADVAVGLIVGVIFGGIGLGIFYLGKAVGRNGLLAIAAALFVLGLVTVQPEVDALALLPVAFALFGVKGRR